MTYSYNYTQTYKPNTGTIIVYLILMVVVIAANWRMFTKAGKPGWAAIIPIYNTWVLYTIICDRGTAMFRLLIPFYNIYWMFKSQIALAHAFGKSTGFGIGLVFLSPIFMCILGFGPATYQGPQEL